MLDPTEAVRRACTLGVVGLLALAGSCSPLAPTTQCHDSSECPWGYACDSEAGYCVRDSNPGVSNGLGAWLCAGSSELLVSRTQVLDTDRGTLDGAGVDVFEAHSQGAGLPAIAVFSFASIEITAGGRLQATGKRALALLACTTADIAGIVDVSATGSDPLVYMETGGPGGFAGGAKGEAGRGPCAGAVGQGDDTDSIRSAGSGGGGHGGRGGDGGPAGTHEIGVGGKSCGEPKLVPLVGGSGGAGQTSITGEGPGGDHLGVGGGGGGAVQISAGQWLTVQSSGGVLAAGGGGGQTGNGGGAGGGAGGAILLEAPAVAIASGAFLAANGGGGAAGDCS